MAMRTSIDQANLILYASSCLLHLALSNGERMKNTSRDLGES